MFTKGSLDSFDEEHDFLFSDAMRQGDYRMDDEAGRLVTFQYLVVHRHRPPVCPIFLFVFVRPWT